MCGNLFAASLYLSKAAMPNEDNAGDGEEDDDAPSAEVASSAWPGGMRPGLVFCAAARHAWSLLRCLLAVCCWEEPRWSVIRMQLHPVEVQSLYV